MRRWFALAAVGVSVLLVACSSSPTEPVDNHLVVAVGAPFQLKVAETALIRNEDIQVQFRSVAEDSRCPADVQCVWEGEAVTVFTVSQRGGASDVRISTLHPSAALSGYRLTLQALEPYPLSLAGISQGEYRARLVVERL